MRVFENLGILHAEQGHPERAIETLEQVLGMIELVRHPSERTRTRAESADALWDTERDRARARELITEALADMRASPEAKSESSVEVREDIDMLESWLEEHRSP